MTVLLYPRKRKPPVLAAADCLELPFSVPNSEWLMGGRKQDRGVSTNSGPEEPVDVVMPSRLGSKRDFLQQLFGRKNRGGLHKPFSSEQTCAVKQIITHGLTGCRQSAGHHDIGRFAPLDEPTGHNGMFRDGLLRGLQLNLQLARHPFIVVVEKCDPSASSGFDALVASRCRSQIARHRSGYKHSSVCAITIMPPPRPSGRVS